MPLKHISKPGKVQAEANNCCIITLKILMGYFPFSCLPIYNNLWHCSTFPAKSTPVTAMVYNHFSVIYVCSWAIQSTRKSSAAGRTQFCERTEVLLWWDGLKSVLVGNLMLLWAIWRHRGKKLNFIPLLLWESVRDGENVPFFTDLLPSMRNLFPWPTQKTGGDTLNLPGCPSGWA